MIRRKPPKEHGRPDPLTVALPPGIAKKVQQMAIDRDMPVSTLVAELLHLGMVSLQYPELDWAEPLRGVDPTDSSFVIGQR